MVFVPNQRPRQQTCFNQNLEAIANPDNQTTFFSEIANAFHDGRKASDCSNPQVVAVRKSSRQDDAIKAGDIPFLVPNKINIAVKDCLDHMPAISVAIGARKDNDAETHLSMPPLSFFGCQIFWR
jgi:hypothetical protein